MKSHRLFICDMGLNVLLRRNFHIIQCEDVGGCHVEGLAVCCAAAAGKAPGTDAGATQGQSPGIAPWCPFIPQCLLELCQSVLSLQRVQVDICHRITLHTTCPVEPRIPEYVIGFY